MTDIPPALLRTFRDETEEMLAELERCALDLGGGDDQVLLESMFRCAHTLKGNASCLGFETLTGVAHHVEDAMSAAVAGRRAADEELVALVLDAIDVIARLGAEIAVADTAIASLCARLAAWGGAVAGAAAAASTGESPLAERVEVGARGAPLTRAIRVEVPRLDRALDLVGEIAITRARLAAAIRGGDRAAADDALEAVDTLVRDLRSGVLALRLVPLRTAFDWFRRAARDLSLAAGKDVQLDVRCDEVEVDVSVADALRAPLTHLVRNAIDHGIELPEARRRDGKSPTGTIALAARQEGASLVVEVSDDGAGLSREALLERGRALALPVDGLSDAEIWELAVVPGLSTAPRVTALSGRGIGMDVVRSTIEGMRGSIALTSRPGHGVTATVHLPLTLSILQGLAVGVGGDVYVLPLDHVVECLDLVADRGIRSTHGGLIELRGEPLPYLTLARALGASQTGAEPRRIVVVEHGGTRAGLAVDHLHGEVQTVIKPLGPLLDRASGLTGTALLSDGRVALVVDVRGLLRAAAT